MGIPENKNLAKYEYYFRPRHIKINWRKIASINFDNFSLAHDYEKIQDNILNITYCNIENELDVDSNFIKLFKVAQFTIEYLLFTQEQLLQKIKLIQQNYQSMYLDAVTDQKAMFYTKKKVSDLKQELNRNRQIIKSYKEIFAICGINRNEINDLIHKCPYCKKTFLSDDFLTSHLERKHYAQLQGMPIDKQQKTIKDSVDKKVDENVYQEAINNQELKYLEDMKYFKNNLNNQMKNIADNVLKLVEKKLKITNIEVPVRNYIKDNISVPEPKNKIEKKIEEVPENEIVLDSLKPEITFITEPKKTALKERLLADKYNAEPLYIDAKNDKLTSTQNDEKIIGELEMRWEEKFQQLDDFYQKRLQELNDSTKHRIARLEEELKMRQKLDRFAKRSSSSTDLNIIPDEEKNQKRKKSKKKFRDRRHVDSGELLKYNKMPKRRINNESSQSHPNLYSNQRHHNHDHPDEDDEDYDDDIDSRNLRKYQSMPKIADSYNNYRPVVPAFMPRNVYLPPQQQQQQPTFFQSQHIPFLPFTQQQPPPPFTLPQQSSTYIERLKQKMRIPPPPPPTEQYNRNNQYNYNIQPENPFSRIKAKFNKLFEDPPTYTKRNEYETKMRSELHRNKEISDEIEEEETQSLESQHTSENELNNMSPKSKVKRRNEKSVAFDTKSSSPSSSSSSSSHSNDSKKSREMRNQDNRSKSSESSGSTVIERATQRTKLQYKDISSKSVTSPLKSNKEEIKSNLSSSSSSSIVSNIAKSNFKSSTPIHRPDKSKKSFKNIPTKDMKEITEPLVYKPPYSLNPLDHPSSTSSNSGDEELDIKHTGHPFVSNFKNKNLSPPLKAA